MLRLTLVTKVLLCALALAGLSVVGQQNLPDGPKPKEQQQPQQNVPDAPQPKASQPNQFPDNAPQAPINAHPDQPDAAPTPAPAQQRQRGGAQNDIITDVGKFGTISIAVNFVQVPVTVKDGSGKLISGLTSNDFKVYE